MQKLFCLLFFLISLSSQAQQPQKLNSAEIFKEIQKLNFLGSVLYVAAHPDDENTRLISYLSNAKNARTAYLSLTRGDGGQNLIGPELRELLGIIRTQELLAARRIDGGEQFFTRANDFGYSKNPEETLEIWNKEEILKDVVGVIRKFRPDVIINRFNAESAGETHGHHTSSAILSTEAFELAEDPSAFPQQAKRLGPWEPKKLFFNTSPWFYDSEEAFEAADKSKFLEFDTGTYFPLLGLSNTEIASLSRSQHQSQGFGSTGSRGKVTEYIELIGGEHPSNNNNLFAGINTTWSRIPGGEEIGEILYEVEENYNFRNPAASIPQLLQAYQLITELEDDFWRELKSEQIKEIIAASAGLYLEAVAQEPLATPGENVKLQLEVINRSPQGMQLLSLETAGSKISVSETLSENESWEKSLTLKIPENAKNTSPYWLREKGTLGMYTVKNEDFIGLPETPNPYAVKFFVNIDGVEIPFEREVVYKTNDPVSGEIYRPFEIVPPVSLNTDSNVLIFANGASKNIQVTVSAMTDSISGKLQIRKLEKWQISPESYNFQLRQEGAKTSFTFTVTPPDEQDKTSFSPVALIDGQEFSSEVVQLDYGHIPVQTLVLPSETQIVKLDIQKQGELIGYIPGAGDVVPQALSQIGYEVEILNPAEITASNLKKYDAVVTGIRAYNVQDALRFKQKELFEYVNNGGNLIVQYNTSRGLVTDNLAPYPLQLSRDRVTDENAEVRFLAKDHPALNFPNKITAADFDSWVQERGLYFPDQWAPQFTPLLSMNDEDETAKKGSLLVAPYGEGYFVYTGLSFFREFPAGVPGAFRLFANLLSLGQEKAAASGAKNLNN